MHCNELSHRFFFCKPIHCIQYLVLEKAGMAKDLGRYVL